MNRSWPRSQSEYERACQVIPGGVNSAARAFGAVGGHPLLIERAQGPFLFDIDNGRYIDYIGSWGPMILGHAHPEVVDAVRAVVGNGSSFGAPTLVETELAEHICEAIPSIEQVRMTSSGTEATMSAIRVARGYTGRNVIVKFAGCYHGHSDGLLVKAGSAATTLGTPSSPGVPAGCTQDTLVAPFNDLDWLTDAFRHRGQEIAAVILEPVVGNMGLVPPLPGFLAGLRELTQSHGTLLIFDEVMTGFRVAWGGAQNLFGIRPDLTTLGKIIGGGMPVGAFGGRKDIMQKVSPAGPVYQAGTLSGNPVAMTCGLTTLRILKRTDPYPALEITSQKLADGISSAANKAGVVHCVQRVGSMLTLFFQSGPVRNYDEALRSDTKLFSRFFWELMSRGIYWPCSQFEALFVSAAHESKIIEETISAVADSLGSLQP